MYPSVIKNKDDILSIVGRMHSMDNHELPNIVMPMIRRVFPELTVDDIIIPPYRKEGRYLRKTMTW